jgi:hypothetical protein
MHKNPFTLKVIPTGGAFCDREKEQQDLVRMAAANSNILLYSPRRYGKTSLIQRVQDQLAAQGSITAYCDLFGISSVDEIAGKIAKAIFSITRKNEGIFNKAIRILTSFRPVLSPSDDGGVSVSVQPALATGGIELLDETLRALAIFVPEAGVPVHVVLDEFQEITEVDNSLAVEGTLRQHIQRIQCAFVFVGSRRRILLDMFNDRKRPFFQSAISYELKALPREELIGFIVESFAQAGKHIDAESASRICDLFAQHPYYTQKFCFLLFDRSEHGVSRDDLRETYQLLLDTEKALFESTLRRLTAVQIAVLTAIAREPCQKIYAAGYMRRHNLRSTGGTQLSLEALAKEDLIEEGKRDKGWVVVDPLFQKWLVSRAL